MKDYLDTHFGIHDYEDEPFVLRRKGSIGYTPRKAQINRQLRRKIKGVPEKFKNLLTQRGVKLCENKQMRQLQKDRRELGIGNTTKVAVTRF